MARVTIPVYTVVPQGIKTEGAAPDYAYVACGADGLAVPNDGKVFLRIEAPTACQVVIDSTALFEGDLETDDRLITLEVDHEAFVGIMNPKIHNHSDAMVHVDSSENDTRVLALRVAGL